MTDPEALRRIVAEGRNHYEALNSTGHYAAEDNLIKWLFSNLAIIISALEERALAGQDVAELTRWLREQKPDAGGAVPVFLSEDYERFSTAADLLESLAARLAEVENALELAAPFAESICSSPLTLKKIRAARASRAGKGERT